MAWWKYAASGTLELAAIKSKFGRMSVCVVFAVERRMQTVQTYGGLPEAGILYALK